MRKGVLEEAEYDVAHAKKRVSSLINQPKTALYR